MASCCKDPSHQVHMHKFPGTKSKNNAMLGILHQQLIHKCMRIVIKLTHLDTCQYHVATGPYGLCQLTMVIVMAWIADLEEQLLVAGVQIYSCLVFTVLSHDLDHWH